MTTFHESRKIAEYAGQHGVQWISVSQVLDMIELLNL